MGHCNKIEKCKAKCCFCLPLRKGLLCMAYARLIVCAATTVAFVLICVQLFKGMEDSYNYATDFFQAVACIIPQVLDIVFTLSFIVAAHEKNRKLSEVFYFYSITMMLVYFLVVMLNIWKWHNRQINMLAETVFAAAWFMEFSYYEFIIFGLAVILLQTYMTVMVRSEVVKLKERADAEMVRQRSTASFRLPKLNIIHA